MKKLISVVSFLGIIILLTWKSNYLFAASTTASALATVIQAIAIVKTADLNFGTASVGDVAKVILPADASAAVFNITGQPNTAFTIQLPATAVTMTTGIGGANRTISVSTFTSTPATTSTLSATGTATLRVGATRAALPATQIAGAYTATFTVSVIY
jgi:hypothetical protein